MRIVVDVMGGDHGCGVVIEGVKRALETDTKITELHLVGNQDAIQSALSACQFQDARVRIVHASEVMTMEDKPKAVLRNKKDSSMARAFDLIAEGRADAIISLGNTGGMLMAATLKLRPLPGVERAGIATVIPAPDNEFVLIDAGANTECQPIHLAQYAVMGSVYSREILGYKKPRVGVLSNGTEEGKGTDLTREAYKLCQQLDLNFIGYTEGHDLFCNKVDVVVCDGFVGNIVLKTCESLAFGIVSMLKRELSRNPKRKLGAYLAQNALRSIKRRMDPEGSGGAPLLGLNGIVMKAHGSARERAIMKAICTTTEALQHQISQVIAREIADATRRLAANPPVETTSPA
jgi:phosphate acyltransferase